MKLLIDKGLDVNAHCKDGWSGLILATENKHFEVVKTLVENGADIDHTNFMKENALHWAHFVEDKRIFEYLL